MSGSAQEGDGGSVEAGPTPSQDLYREKPASTVVRILTVSAYLLSVSLAAILLSVYYICVWKSPELPKSYESYEMLHAIRGDHQDYNPALTLDSSPYNHIGGSNTPVNDTAPPPTLDNVDVTNADDTVDETLNYENSTLPTPSQDNDTSATETFNVTTVT